MNVAVVGAGLAGVACARVLRSAGHEVTVFERSLVVGGRMASPRVHERRVDTGAAYFTVATPEFTEVAADWRERGLAQEWTDTMDVFTTQGHSSKSGPMRWRAAGGLRSLVADLAEPLDVHFESAVAAVGSGPTVDGARFDAVVLAMPDPQALRLLDPSLTAARAQVAGREWEPVTAVSVGARERTWGELAAMFVNDHPSVALVADDGARRGDGAPVLVAHTTVDLAAAHLDDPDAVIEPVVAALPEIVGADLDVVWAQAHRWGMAKPAARREESFWLADGIGLCGDGWGTSKVETAWTSGNALGLALAGVT